MENKVTLTNFEIEICNFLANLRMDISKNKNLSNFNGAIRVIEIDLLGALCELAFAKFMNIYPVFGVNTFKGFDVGKYQIRGTKYKNGRLIVRKNDKDADIFVLIVQDGKEFTVAGYMTGAEAKRVGEWQEVGGRPGCWWVPQEKLHKFEKGGA